MCEFAIDVYASIGFSNLPSTKIISEGAGTRFSPFSSSLYGIAPSLFRFLSGKGPKGSKKASTYLRSANGRSRSHVPEARDAVYHVAMLKSTLRNPVGSARSRWRTFFANQLHFCLALGLLEWMLPTAVMEDIKAIGMSRLRCFVLGRSRCKVVNVYTFGSLLFWVLI